MIGANGYKKFHDFIITFHNFPLPVILHDFPSLENDLTKFDDSPWPGHTQKYATRCSAESCRRRVAEDSESCNQMATGQSSLALALQWLWCQIQLVSLTYLLGVKLRKEGCMVAVLQNTRTTTEPLGLTWRTNSPQLEILTSLNGRLFSSTFCCSTSLTTSWPSITCPNTTCTLQQIKWYCHCVGRYQVFKKSSHPPKTFWNIFTPVKSFCTKFCKFVAIHIHIYLPIFADLS